jgi:hypothetical protein
VFSYFSLYIFRQEKAIKSFLSWNKNSPEYNVPLISSMENFGLLPLFPNIWSLLSMKKLLRICASWFCSVVCQSHTHILWFLCVYLRSNIWRKKIPSD